MRLRDRDRKLCLLRRKFSWGEVHEYRMPGTKDSCLKDKSELGLNSILKSSTTLRLQCVRVYVHVVMQKGVREREKDREMVHAQTYLITSKRTKQDCQRSKTG